MKTYEKYKSSEIEWMGDIPQHWGVTRIKYTPDSKPLSFIDGDWIESKDIVFDEEIRYITTGNIGEGIFKVQGHSFITEDTFHQLNCTEVFPGDLLISRLNKPIGRSCIIPDLGFRVVTAVDNVIYRPNKSFDKIYLNFLMNNSKYYDYTELIARGATMQRISRGLLAEIKICVPPLQEQTTIANFLDTKTTAIDKSIADKENLINLLEEEKKALINEAVTKGINKNVKHIHSGIDWLGEIPEHWEVKKLKYLVNKIGSGVTPRGGSDVYELEGVPLLRSQNIYNDGLRLEDVAYINEYTHDKMSGSKVQKDDILLNITGASLGRCYFFDGSIPEANVNQHVCIIRVNKNTNFQYIRYCLISDFIVRQIENNYTGSGREGLSNESLNNFNFAIPLIEEQTQIVNYIETESQNISTKVNLIKEEITLLKEYRQALIFEAVTGKIDVRDF